MDVLRGEWEIVRRIPGTARLRGAAVFSSIGENRLAYKETGRLVLNNGQTTNAEREYIFTSAPGGFDVFFNDRPERLFHEARIKEHKHKLVATGEHLCINDKYRARYQWYSNNKFSVSYRVKGPKKDYCMVTMYKRRHSDKP